MNSANITSFLDYLNTTKPFHTKLTDTSVVLQLAAHDTVNVQAFDNIDLTSIKLSSNWSTNSRENVKLTPVYTTPLTTKTWQFAFVEDTRDATNVFDLPLATILQGARNFTITNNSDVVDSQYYTPNVDSTTSPVSVTITFDFKPTAIPLISVNDGIYRVNLSNTSLVTDVNNPSYYTPSLPGLLSIEWQRETGALDTFGSPIYAVHRSISFIPDPVTGITPTSPYATISTNKVTFHETVNATDIIDVNYPKTDSINGSNTSFFLPAPLSVNEVINGVLTTVNTVVQKTSISSGSVTELMFGTDYTLPFVTGFDVLLNGTVLTRGTDYYQPTDNTIAFINSGNKMTLHNLIYTDKVQFRDLTNHAITEDLVFAYALPKSMANVVANLSVALNGTMLTYQTDYDFSEAYLAGTTTTFDKIYFLDISGARKLLSVSDTVTFIYIDIFDSTIKTVTLLGTTPSLDNEHYTLPFSFSTEILRDGYPQVYGTDYTYTSLSTISFHIPLAVNETVTEIISGSSTGQAQLDLVPINSIDGVNAQFLSPIPNTINFTVPLSADDFVEFLDPILFPVSDVLTCDAKIQTRLLYFVTIEHGDTGLFSVDGHNTIFDYSGYGLLGPDGFAVFKNGDRLAYQPDSTKQNFQYGYSLDLVNSHIILGTALIEGDEIQFRTSLTNLVLTAVTGQTFNNAINGLVGIDRFSVIKNGKMLISPTDYTLQGSDTITFTAPLVVTDIVNFGIILPTAIPVIPAPPTHTKVWSLPNPSPKASDPTTAYQGFDDPANFDILVNGVANTNFTFDTSTNPYQITFLDPAVPAFTSADGYLFEQNIFAKSVKERNVLFTGAKNVFTFIADGSDTFRSYDIPIMQFPRTNKYVLKQDSSLPCYPVVSTDPLSTAVWTLPFINTNYFALYVDGVHRQFGTFTFTPMMTDTSLGDTSTALQATITFNAPLAVSSVVEIRVNYFAPTTGVANTYRIPFNTGFSILKNGVLLAPSDDYTQLSNSVIQLSAPLTITDEVVVEYYSIDRFEIEINGTPRWYQVFVYDNNTGEALKVPDDTVGFVPWDTSVGLVPFIKALPGSADNRTQWLRDTLLDPAVWPTNPTGTVIAGEGYPIVTPVDGTVYIDNSNTTPIVYQYLNYAWAIATGTNGEPVNVLGWDNISSSDPRDAQSAGFDYTEWDGIFEDTNVVISLTTKPNVVGGFPVTEYYCTLLFGDVPLLGTKISFNFQQGSPWLNKINTSITDTGFMNVSEVAFQLGGFDSTPFADDTPFNTFLNSEGQAWLSANTPWSTEIFASAFDLDVILDKVPGKSFTVHLTQEALQVGSKATVTAPNKFWY